MTQIFASLPSEFERKIFCCYVNATNQIQIARIINISNWYFERVVFPGERLLFEALPEAQLEIHTHTNLSAILFGKLLAIACKLNKKVLNFFDKN